MTLISINPRTWSRSEYQRLADSGVFDQDRVELFRGEIVSKSPQGPVHSGAVENLSGVLFAKFGDQKTIRIQLPFAAPDNSEPEPDAVVLDREYALDCRRNRVHPGQAELIVEVARTSLNYDRLEKSGLYAEAGVSEYWIVNLVDMVVEVRREPVSDPESPYGWSYASLKEYSPEDIVDHNGIRVPLCGIFLGLQD